MAFPSEDPITVYQQGQQVTLFVDFTNKAGDAADPDAVLLFYIEGNEVGTIVPILQVALSNPAVGRWEFELQTPQDGDKAIKPWQYRYEATSALDTGVNSVDEKRFELAPSPFYPPSA